jgi:hypothetical protein
VEGQKRKEQDCPPDPCTTVPWHVLVVAFLWLVLIVASFILYERVDAFASFVRFELGRLPFEVIWFGAVGGWLISAQGIFEWNRKWLRSYDYWHYARPVLGALMGTLGALIFIVLNDAATSQKIVPNPVFYDVIALGIGYREASFRRLIGNLFDTFILPGDKAEKTNRTPKPPGQGPPVPS